MFNTKTVVFISSEHVNRYRWNHVLFVINGTLTLFMNGYPLPSQSTYSNIDLNNIIKVGSEMVLIIDGVQGISYSTRL